MLKKIVAALAEYRKRYFYPRLMLSLPPQTLEAIIALKLMPEDDLTQVFKDALQTHANVREALKIGGRIMVHRGAEVVPLPLNHLTTHEKRRASWTVIKGDKDT